MRQLTTRYYYSLGEIAELYEDTFGYDSNNIEEIPTTGLGTFCATIADYESAIGDTSIWSDNDTAENQEMWEYYLWPEFKEASIVYVDHEIYPWEEDEEPTSDEIWAELKPIFPRMIRWLIDSTARYTTLINAYSDIQNNLLGKVEVVSNASGVSRNTGSVSSSGEGSVSRSYDSNVDAVHKSTTDTTDLQLHNDTPQAAGDWTEDPYTSDARKTTNQSALHETNTTATDGSESVSNSSNNSSDTVDTGSTSSTSTVGSDITTPIERLNEVRLKLRNLYADWADEFAQFVFYAD